jgi:hypothetical protein
MTASTFQPDASNPIYAAVEGCGSVIMDTHPHNKGGTLLDEVHLVILPKQN